MENKPTAVSQVPSIFPTAYFPSLTLMAAMVQTSDLLTEIYETFPKQTHRNRTVILTANGPMTLSVPVVRPNGNHTLTADITVAYTERWNVTHWRAIESAYSAAPYFLYYRDPIEKLLMAKYDRLITLNEALLEALFKALKSDCTIRHTDNYIRNAACSHDYRDRFSYKRPDINVTLPPYTQVFCDRQAFDGNVGILDLLFNKGPEAKDYLLQIKL
ncbi:MAG: WbqC family protein [Bacteroidales bacterium]|jgi:hypothetical protein|nr:WbqC family protein [Bacteroidales bacterium]